jgi:hypothetical protein
VSSTVPGLQISVGHRALSGEILPFVRSKLFMIGHLNGFDFGWSNLRSQKLVYLTHFLLIPTRKQYNHGRTGQTKPVGQYSLHSRAILAY